MIDRAWSKSVIEGACLLLWRTDEHPREVSPAAVLEQAGVRAPRSEVERLILLGVVADVSAKLAAARHDGGDERLAAFFACIRAHSRLPDLTRARVARMTGLSDSWLAHNLKQATGRSFTDHLADSRLADAQRLLRHSQASIKHVALTVGLRGDSALTKLFRKTISLTPTAWRARARGAGKLCDR